MKMNIHRDCFSRRSLMIFHAKNLPLITCSCGGGGGGGEAFCTFLLHICIHAKKGEVMKMHIKLRMLLMKLMDGHQIPR